MKNVITNKPQEQFSYKGKIGKVKKAKWEGSKADKAMDKKQGAKEGSKKDNAIDKKMQKKMNATSGKKMLGKAMGKLSKSYK